MFKTTAIDTLKQDKKCQACWYMILSTMSGSTTTSHKDKILSALKKEKIENETVNDFEKRVIQDGKFVMGLSEIDSSSC